MTNPDLQATLELLESISLKMPEASLTKIAIDNAITLLKAQQWISVEDELPEPRNQLVIGFIENGPDIELTPRILAPIQEQWGYVTHWMPLPAPPQESSDE